MLESATFVLQPAPISVSGVRRLDIRDGDTGEPLGFAREHSERPPRLLRWLVGKWQSPRTLEVRESPDDSLVFTIRCWVGWFRSHVIVQDALGELVGRCWWNGERPASGAMVYSRNEEPVTRVERDCAGVLFRFVDEPGGSELARVAKGDSGIDAIILRLSPALAEQPLTKMLLLGATLAMKVMIPDES